MTLMLGNQESCEGFVRSLRIVKSCAVSLGEREAISCDECITILSFHSQKRLHRSGERS